ncbi:MAG: bL21 family ribosomal protein, partial [Oscillospiraceae bacterium]|nr:bL21 family ribosomal protein [Oscillospiraceae bacterium]
MQAIFVTGGKQYKVSEGDVIYVEKLNVEGETV